MQTRWCNYSTCAWPITVAVGSCVTSCRQLILLGSTNVHNEGNKSCTRQQKRDKMNAPASGSWSISNIHKDCIVRDNSANISISPSRLLDPHLSLTLFQPACTQLQDSHVPPSLPGYFSLRPHAETFFEFWVFCIRAINSASWLSCDSSRSWQATLIGCAVSLSGYTCV